MTEWYIEENGAAAGPFNVRQIQMRADAGSLKADTLVWSSGMGDWKPLAQTSLRQTILQNDIPAAKPYTPLPYRTQPNQAVSQLYGNAPAANLYQPIEKNVRAIVAIVVSGSALTFAFVPVFGVIVAAVGTILGFAGLARAKELQVNNANPGQGRYLANESRGISIAAIWIGLVSMVFALLMTMLSFSLDDVLRNHHQHNFHNNNQHRFEKTNYSFDKTHAQDDYSSEGYRY